MSKPKNHMTRSATKPRSAGKTPLEISGSATSGQSSAGAGAQNLELPKQNPPVERDYLRALVGRQGRPANQQKSNASGTKGSKATVAGDYFVQLSTFHILPNRRG